MGALGSVVAGLSWASVFLGVIMQVKDVCELVANILARFLRTIFHNDNLKVFQFLFRKALQELLYFVGAVVNGNDDAVFHYSFTRCR